MQPAVPELDRRRPDLLVADGLIGPAVAGRITQALERAEFEEQRLGSRLHRHRERAAIDDPGIADGLWAALSPHIGPLGPWLAGSGAAANWVPPVERWAAVGCNPRSRIYRYRAGADFAVHRDIPWRPDETTCSVLTVLVYLPGGRCVGGDTRLGDDLIEPAPWRVAVFDHNVSHEGTMVEQGEKLVLRNDVIARAL